MPEVLIVHWGRVKGTASPVVPVLIISIKFRSSNHTPFSRWQSWWQPRHQKGVWGRATLPLGTYIGRQNTEKSISVGKWQTNEILRPLDYFCVNFGFSRQNCVKYSLTVGKIVFYTPSLSGPRAGPAWCTRYSNEWNRHSVHRSMSINTPVHEIMGLGWSGNGPSAHADTMQIYTSQRHEKRGINDSAVFFTLKTTAFPERQIWSAAG